MVSFSSNEFLHIQEIAGCRFTLNVYVASLKTAYPFLALWNEIPLHTFTNLVLRAYCHSGIGRQQALANIRKATNPGDKVVPKGRDI